MGCGHIFFDFFGAVSVRASYPLSVFFIACLADVYFAVYPQSVLLLAVLFFISEGLSCLCIIAVCTELAVYS